MRFFIRIPSPIPHGLSTQPVTIHQASAVPSPPYPGAQWYSKHPYGQPHHQA